MKKFLSLMLAVLLLVSALPFAAFAAEGESTEPTEFNVNIKVFLDGEDSGYDKQYTVTEENPLNFTEGQAMALLTKSNRTFDKWTNSDGVEQNDKLTLNWLISHGKEEDEYFVCVYYNVTEPEVVDPCADGTHDFGEWTVTKEATCGAAGVETRICKDNPEHKETRAIPATGDHNYEEGVCTVCKADKVYKLTFVYDGGISTVNVVNGESYYLPTVDLVDGHRIEKWVGDKGDEIDGDARKAKFHIGKSTTYEAVYYETNDDGLVDLTVYAYYYVDGEVHHKAKLFVEHFTEARKSNMVNWLYGSNDGVAAVRAALDKLEGADGYQWYPTKFYNCYDDGEVANWDDLKTNGNKSVYVKVESKKAIEATILLHIHTAKEYAIARTVKMPGYTKDDFVSYNEALAAVKKYYTGSNLSMSDLYSESDWEDLMDGLKSSGSKTIKVEDYGTTEIHVIVKNATSKTSSNADPSNPKTGDYITIAVGTMAMAAAALVTLAELKKRKMI